MILSSNCCLNFIITRPVPWIQENIKKHLTKFLRQIEESDQKDDFRVGYEARQVLTIESVLLKIFGLMIGLGASF